MTMNFWTVFLACWLALCAHLLTGMIIDIIKDSYYEIKDKLDPKAGFGEGGEKKKPSEYSANSDRIIGFKMKCDEEVQKDPAERKQKQ